MTRFRMYTLSLSLSLVSYTHLFLKMARHNGYIYRLGLSRMRVSARLPETITELRTLSKSKRFISSHAKRQGPIKGRRAMIIRDDSR